MIHSIDTDKKKFLILSSIVMSLSFSAWLVLLNNFTIQEAAFTGKEIGLLHSFREIPGFLAFTAVFLLLLVSEQTLALISLCLLTIGVAITGLFPFEYGLYATTVLMSTGFHYFETVNNSLTLQWVNPSKTAEFMGKMISIRSTVALSCYALIWVFFSLLGFSFVTTYFIFGGLGFVVLLILWVSVKKIPFSTQQHKKIILRKRYSLYYLLTFFSGARRQIFVVFASFMMVEKFGFDPSKIAVLFIANHVINMLLAPKIGKWIAKIGEKRSLTIEYLGLIGVFIGYAWVSDGQIAAILYVIDHVFFAMAIAIKTYFQKIADPEDIASTSAVSFTINHIAAIVIPVLFGLIWLISPSIVFYAGALLASISLVLAQFISIPAPTEFERTENRSREN